VLQRVIKDRNRCLVAGQTGHLIRPTGAAIANSCQPSRIKLFLFIGTPNQLYGNAASLAEGRIAVVTTLPVKRGPKGVSYSLNKQTACIKHTC
jgi:hypothetical protein